VLDRRLDALLVVCLLAASTAWPFGRIKKVDRVEGEPGAIRLGFRFPAHFTLEQADRTVERVETALASHREELQIRDVYSSFRAQQAQVMLLLHDPDRWVLSMEDVIERIKRLLPVLPGVELRVNWRESESGSGNLSLRLYGPDSEELARLGEEVARALRQVRGVVDVETELERGADEIRVTVDRVLAQKYGVDSWSVAGALQYALRGDRLADFTAGDLQLPMMLQVETGTRESLDLLRNLGVRARDGRDLPVGAVAEFGFARGLGQIQRENRRTSMTLKVFTRDDDLERFERDLRARLDRFELPRGASWDMGERYERMQKQAESFLLALLLACTFVFLLMGVLFESFVLPFSVIVSIPFAFFGVYWTLWATDTPLDVMASIGVVILMGVVVNNAIVLVDAVNRLRLQGLPRAQALVEAGRSRFRAIWLTALTTIVGLVPMAVGSSNIVGVPYFPLGRTVMGGLLASTLLTLYVVPLCYALFDDLRVWALRVRDRG
jgi:HAE1 family hydrophobic/amphiphilic exporter-1